MNQSLHDYFRHFIATVWLLNGLYCKVLGQVPRHEQIVETILGNTYSHELTIVIGVLEICLGFIIYLNFQPKFMAIFQIVIVMSMNLIEFQLAQHWLLWGAWNLVFAMLFCTMIYVHTFVFKPFEKQK
ncbi:DoxX-like family protein [Flectobacillus longus]|uniref:DoxX-like family protein n=1 Tax=Flectobacillus longus TaxID=2984207 RepID=UPI0024B7AF46|nr:DoxX-like family protein [Flectobacillus longus]MDI9881849.1 DoxX-like family protein [Flectobacillus longus]